MSIGDMISGYTFGGRLVTGRVTEIKDNEIKVTGIDVRETRRGNYTVSMKDVLTRVAHTY
jgi:hypothetical protein